MLKTCSPLVRIETLRKKHLAWQRAAAKEIEGDKSDDASPAVSPAHVDTRSSPSTPRHSSKKRGHVPQRALVSTQPYQRTHSRRTSTSNGPPSMADRGFHNECTESSDDSDKTVEITSAQKDNQVVAVGSSPVDAASYQPSRRVS